MRWVLVRVVLASLAVPGGARADSCEQDVTALRAHATDAAHRIHRWNLTWQIAFGAAAAGQLGLALTEQNPLGPFDRDYQETLYVGAAKATLAVTARLVLPLRITSPAPTGDACRDRAALQRAIADAGRRERNLFWMTHIGGLAVNAAGAIVLGERRSWSVGAVSFAIGYPVGLLSLYTMPRSSWHLARSATWSVQADAHTFFVAIAGRF
jgi:hypothetical protein